MEYKNMTLKQLMEAVCQEQAKKPQPKEETFPELLDLEEEFHSFEESDDPIEDIEQCITQTLAQLEPFHLQPQEKQTIREFLTFHLQVKQDDGSEPSQTMYNLILTSEETDTSAHMVEILRTALNIPTHKTQQLQEAEACRNYESRPRTPFAIDAGIQLLVINDCREAPRMNMDSGSSVRDKAAKAVEAYNGMWNSLCEHVRKNPRTIMIVCGQHAVYRSSLRHNHLLSKRICAHHIHLTERTPEELLQDCLDRFRSSSFAVSVEFEQKLSAYFPAAYRASDLNGRVFVEDLVSQIYSLYYCRKRQMKLLTADCVPDDAPQFQSVETVLSQMDELVGLQQAKEEFSNIYKMQLAGLSEGSGSYHMLFSGNPGTGKTTVAKMAADLLYSMNVIKKNKLVVAKPSDMISEWIGGTGTKAMEVIRRAYNGVLFVDEAYGIATMDRGEDLLNILVQEMENNSHKLVVILAGYTREMRELLKRNPGLSSRISRQIEFEDYTQEELAEIFLSMCQKEGFSLDPSARDELDDCIAALMTKEFFGNAREIRNMLQELKEAWSEEYYEAVTRDGAENVQLPRVFATHHFAKIMPPKKEVSINDLIGLDVMKNKLEQFKRQALYQKHLKEKGFSGLSDFSMHMIFTGNPGTGKTTVAKLIADDLYSVGMLRTNRLVVAERKDLVSAYGDTGRKTADVIQKAVGGVLFIDEAYSLADRQGLSNECIEVLLTAMEEHKSDTVFIFAGYVDEMRDFLAMNPGIKSRIGYTFHFEDYTPDELTQIYAEKMRKAGFLVSAGALKKVREVMEYFHVLKNFGNGRFVDHVIHQTISQRANRDFTNQYRNIQVQDIPSIKELIETASDGMHLYDPSMLSEEQHHRTTVHELGHAIVMVSLDPKNIPKSISIRSNAGSFGRVSLNVSHDNTTEKELLNFLATALGGKNAERLVLGSHGTGCVGDYTRAKRIAQDMVEQCAMTTYGDTPAKILETADKLSMEILEQNKACFEPLVQLLRNKHTLTGEDFVKALEDYRQTQGEIKA